MSGTTRGGITMHDYQQAPTQQPWQGGGTSGPAEGGAEPVPEAPVPASSGATSGTAAVLSHWAEEGGQAGAPPPGGGGLRSPRFAGDLDFEGALAGRPLRPGWGNAGTVMKLQQSLTSLGHSPGAVDGQWGGRTSAAVQQHQRGAGLAADAIIGPRTMCSLDAADAAGGQATAGQTAVGPAAGSGPGQGAATPAVPPPDPARAAEEEAKCAAEGQGAIAALQAAGGPLDSGGGGHTQGGAVAGLPGWFTELQQLLIRSAGWGQLEERSQNVLYRYGVWKTQLTHGRVPASIEVFFRCIGRSEANDAAARKGGFRRTNDIGGRSGKQNWCQAAPTSAVEMALRERGLRLRGGADKWMRNRAGRKGVQNFWSRNAYQVELSPGDWVRYVSPYGPETGHAVTVLEASGDTFTHVSGNAGGESARVGQSRRGVPPDSYSIDAVVLWKGGQRQQPAVTRPGRDEVWTFSVTKIGRIFEELEKLDQTDPTSPAYAAFLQEMGLERIPG